MVITSIIIIRKVPGKIALVSCWDLDLPEDHHLITNRQEQIYNNYYYYYYYFLGAIAPPPKWALASSFTRFIFLDHTRHTAVGTTPLDEWSARRRDLYLTTHNTHNGQTSMPPVGFKPTISAGERPQTYVLDRTATGTGSLYMKDLFTLWYCVSQLLKRLESLY